MTKHHSSLSKLVSLKVSQNSKITITLVYAVALLAFELFFPVSFLISTPFAVVAYLVMKSFGISSLNLLGSSVIINGTPVDFTDLCTGMPAIVLGALFMWVGKISKKRIFAFSLSLILLNISRLALVAHLLAANNYDVAATAHNLSYAALTAAVLIVMVQSLRRSIPWLLFIRSARKSTGKKPLKKPRHLRNKKAVSPLIATVLLVGIAIVASVLVAGWTMGWFRGAGGAVLDGSQTRIYIDPATGKGKIHLHIANSGTGSASIRAVNITGEKTVIITFDTTTAGSYKPAVTAPTGYTWGTSDVTISLAGSTPGVAISDDDSVGANLGVLNLPANSYADIVLEFTSTTANHNLNGVFNLGGSYRGTFWPKAGTGASPTDFTVRIESYAP